MRGFTERVLVDTALEWVDRNSSVLDTETVGVDKAHLRVLSDDVIAATCVPPFDRSAMDGFAVRGEETDGAGDYNPLTFPVSGESMPGKPHPDELAPGCAVRIMTGAPIPIGADAVVPAEYARETNGSVEITTAVSPGKHVGRRGEDIRSGTRILTAGRRLRPQDVGLLASVGISGVSAVRRPRVLVLTTGNELAAPGTARGTHQIFDSNSTMLSGLIRRDGGTVVVAMSVEDDRDSIQRAMTTGGADVVLVSGGSSVGAEDHAPAILNHVGELALHGVAMRPSSPAGMGRISRTLVFLLPGNPVSCLCAYDFFAGRAIRLLGGRSPAWPYVSHEAALSAKIVSSIGRVDYCRVRINDDKIEPLATSGASILSSTTRADGFVVVPAECEGYGAGNTVTAYLYDPPS